MLTRSHVRRCTCDYPLSLPTCPLVLFVDCVGRSNVPGNAGHHEAPPARKALPEQRLHAGGQHPEEHWGGRVRKRLAAGGGEDAAGIWGARQAVSAAFSSIVPLNVPAIVAASLLPEIVTVIACVVPSAPNTVTVSSALSPERRLSMFASSVYVQLPTELIAKWP